MSVKRPQISVNKLAEFMVSKAARQRRLLRERKYPDPDFQMGMYYREASESVSQYLAGDQISTENIDAKIQIIQQKNTDKIGTQRRLGANIESMERFLGMLDDFDFGDTVRELGAHSPPKLVFHGVEISVRPDVILRGEKKGKPLIGAVKMHFSKGYKMNDEVAGYISAAVHEYCERHLVVGEEKVFHEYCQVFDIGSGQVFRGVKAKKARLKDIEDTCKNIADIWANL